MSEDNELDALKAELEAKEARLAELEKKMEENGNNPVEVKLTGKEGSQITETLANLRFDMEWVFDYLEAISNPGSPRRKFRRPTYVKGKRKLTERTVKGDKVKASFTETIEDAVEMEEVTTARGTKKKRYHYA